MKSAPASIAEPGGAADVVVRRQLAGLEDDLQMGRFRPGRAQASFTAWISSKTFHVAAREEGAAVDHHVDLVGTGGDGLTGVGELDDRAARPAGKAVATEATLIPVPPRRPAPPWRSAAMSG